MNEGRKEWMNEQKNMDVLKEKKKTEVKILITCGNGRDRKHGTERIVFFNWENSK